MLVSSLNPDGTNFLCTMKISLTMTDCYYDCQVKPWYKTLVTIRMCT